MKLRHISVLAVVVLIAGCAGTIQFASISEAYKHYDEGDYEEALVLIQRAENASEMTPGQKAEFAFLKAQAYEGLGQADDAAILYTYIRDQHPSSEYGYRARRKLERTAP